MAGVEFRNRFATDHIIAKCKYSNTVEPISSVNTASSFASLWHKF